MFIKLLERISPLIAGVALFVSLYAAHLSSTSIEVNEKAARAQLFANFQQQYSAIASQFPENLQDPSWQPKAGSPDWWKLKRYWDLCYAEWYATQKLHPELYGPLWDTFYSGVIGNSLTTPSLRGVLTERIRRAPENGTTYADFYKVLEELAKKRGVSLRADEGSGK
jgi:hypothetical protein